MTRDTTRRIIGLTAAGVICLILAAYVLTLPHYLHLRQSLDTHFYSFTALSEGDITEGLALHARSLRQIRSIHLWLGLGFIGAGWAALVAALRLAHLTPWPPLHARRGGSKSQCTLQTASHHRPTIQIGVGVLALLLLADVNANVLGLDWSVSIHLQMILFAAGIGLVTWGLGGGRLQDIRGWLDRMNRSEALALAGIMLLALAVRTWNLEDALHRFLDEVHFINAINDVLRDDQTRLLARFGRTEYFPYTYVFPYLQAGTVRLLGHTITAVRLPSAILGSLNALALYALTRELFDRRIALLSALLLAVYPPHVHFSRIGVHNVADPVFGMFAVTFLARGLSHGRRMDFALAGAAFGLTQYFYEGGRLLYPALALAWLIGLRLLGRERLNMRGLGITLAAALIVAAPVYIMLAAEGYEFSPRIDQIRLSNTYWDALLTSGDPALWTAHLWHSVYPLLATIYLPDLSWFYADRNPLLLPGLIPAFVAGLGIVIVRWRWPGALLVILWLAGHTAFQSLLIDPVLAQRYVPVFPVYMLLVAVGIVTVADLLGLSWVGHSPALTRTRAITTGLVGLLVLALTVGQVRYYFGPYLDHFNVFIRPGHDGEDAIFRALDFPDGTHVHIVALDVVVWDINLDAMRDFWDVDLVVDVVFPDQVTAEYLSSLPRDVDHAFFVDMNFPAVIAALRAIFPVDGPHYSPYNIPRFKQLALFYVAAAASS